MILWIWALVDSVAGAVALATIVVVATLIALLLLSLLVVLMLAATSIIAVGSACFGIVDNY